MKQDFLAKRFSPPPLLTIEYYSGYLLFISYSTICEYACVNTRKKGRFYLREITSKTWWTWSVFSIIAENIPHAHHKAHLHTMKVYNTRPVGLTIEVLLIKILLFFDHWSYHLFRSNQRFQEIKIVNRLSMHDFRHAATLGNTWDHDSGFGAHTRKKRKERLAFRVSHLKQATLKTQESHVLSLFTTSPRLPS